MPAVNSKDKKTLVLIKFKSGRGGGGLEPTSSCPWVRVDVWDFNPEENVTEKIRKINEVKDGRGLRKLIKVGQPVYAGGYKEMSSSLADQ